MTDKVIEWEDETGHNVLSLTPLVFHTERIDPHPFENELRQYMDGDRVASQATGCWCRMTEEHPIHDLGDSSEMTLSNAADERLTDPRRPHGISQMFRHDPGSLCVVCDAEGVSTGAIAARTDFAAFLDAHRPGIVGDDDEAAIEWWLMCSCGWDNDQTPDLDWNGHMRAALDRWRGAPDE